jgi:hypothetical protein
MPQPLSPERRTKVNNLNKMSKGVTWFAVVALLVGSIGFGLRPSAEAAPSAQKNGTDRHDRNPFEQIPIDGAVENGGTFRGTLDVVSFTEDNGQVVANGLVNGTLRDAGGRRIGDVEDVFATGFPVDLGQSGQHAAGASAQGSTQGLAAAPVQTETVTPVITGTATPAPGVVSCRILFLDLGPLDLNLLGLRVQLNDIHLRITAEPGPGNLLGNLLCAVANLLGGGPIPGQLNQIIALLNRIIDLLGG